MNEYTEKSILKKISSYKSSMKKEKQKFGMISDGYGKRFILFELYYMLGDHEKAREYFAWYRKEFPDDGCDPIALLFWALSLYAMGEKEMARYRLAEMMLKNVYIIPLILGENVKEHDMWHGSNTCEKSYFQYVPQPAIEKISAGEKEWMRELYYSADFERIRNRHIEIYQILKETRDIDERGRLFDECRGLLMTLNDKRMGSS